MAWQLGIKQFKRCFFQAISGISCCDLCGENVKKTVLLGCPLPQTLLCQHCINDLPFFNQALIAGNLLSWPAIHSALPNINFDRLFSLAPYIYPLDHWLSQFKYSGRFELAQLFSALLCAQWQAMFADSRVPAVDLVLSVPLNIKKWQSRGYNQAHLIAKSFSQQLTLPYDDKLVVRIKNNDSQMGKTGSQRRKNLTNAFTLQHPLTSDIKHIVLIDDVVTTGTTASEITRLLKEVGVETVTLVTVCLTLPKTN